MTPILRLSISLVFLTVIVFLLPSKSFAAQVWYDGSSTPQERPCPTSGSFICNDGGSLFCGSGTATTIDLTPCIIAGKTFNNSCNTNNWTLTYAKSCTGVSTSFLGFCSVNFNYDTHTCSVGDSCNGQPYLYPGICDAGRFSPGGNPDDACVSSSTAYKTCCTSDGNVNGACTGGNHSGSCPGGSTTVMCGVSSSTCAALYGQIPCTTASCGGDACSILRPEPPPPPQPTPPPPSGSCQCTYGESCVTQDGRAGSRTCYGISGTSSGTNVCKYDEQWGNSGHTAGCNPDCTGCRANAQIQPGGNTGGGNSAGPSDVRIYVEPITSLKDKSLLVTATLRGNCKSNVRLRTGNRTNISGRECWVGGFNTCNCKVRTAAEGCPPGTTCQPHDNDRSRNPKDQREGWGQWICPAENTGSFQATVETYAPFGEECTESTPYTVNPSARIIGRFFHDSNGDGIRQSGEPLIRQSDNLCKDTNGNGTCDSGEPKESCSGLIRGTDAYVEVSGQSSRNLAFCDSGGPYFDFGILPTGTYTVRFRNQGWAFTTQSDFENISIPGRREFLFGSRYPPCTNTTPGTNQLTGCLWDGTNFNLPDGGAPSGSSLTSPVPDTVSALDQNWGETAPNDFVKADQFSGRWRGNFTFKTSGTYTFWAGADDGVRLKIGGTTIVDSGTTIIDSWIDTGYTERQSAPYKFLTAGPHLVELEYYDNYVDARASLRWVFTPNSNAWIQTIGGDVHSNGRIKVPGGP